MAALYAQTDRFTVVTTESARRADIARSPRQLPDAALGTASGEGTTLSRLLRDDGRLTVVNFMYTRCISICLAMGSELQHLQADLKAQGLGGQVRILSLSFDPADTQAYLTRYAAGMRADANLWQFATLTDATQRKALLDTFGIIVIPAPYGQFEHNAAYHVVTPGGRLERILDIGSRDAVLGYVSRRAAPPKEAASRADAVLRDETVREVLP